VRAGTAGCGGQASATAVVRIIDTSLLTLSPVDQDITICEDYSSDVRVEFNISSESRTPLALPEAIVADDGRTCTRDTTVECE
jgi:hypothetical protein